MAVCDAMPCAHRCLVIDHIGRQIHKAVASSDRSVATADRYSLRSAGLIATSCIHTRKPPDRLHRKSFCTRSRSKQSYEHGVRSRSRISARPQQSHTQQNSGQFPDVAWLACRRNTGPLHGVPVNRRQACAFEEARADSGHSPTPPASAGINKSTMYIGWNRHNARLVLACKVQQSCHGALPIPDSRMCSYYVD